MEEMLKNWFPHIEPQQSDQANTAELMEETTLSKKPKVRHLEELSQTCVS